MSAHDSPEVGGAHPRVVEMATRMAVVRSVPVEYRLVPGRAGTVVVFHGGHFRAGLPLNEAALVAAGYTVLVPSRPGYGRTPLAAGPDPARFALTTVELCRLLGLVDIHAALGVSAGGPTAVAMAALCPSQVRALVLHSARSSLPFPEGTARLAAPIAFHPRTEAASWSVTRQLMLRRPDSGLRLMLGSLSTLPARVAVDDLSRPEQELLAATFARMRSGTGFLNDVRERTDPGLEQQVTQPALIIASRTDGQIRWRHTEQLAATIARATTWASPSLSHLIWFGSGGPATHQRTDEFLAAL